MNGYLCSLHSFLFLPPSTFSLSISIYSTDHQRKQCAHSKICFENNFNLPRGSKVLWIHSDEKWMKVHVRSVCVCGAVLFDVCAFIHFLSKGISRLWCGVVWCVCLVPCKVPATPASFPKALVPRTHAKECAELGVERGSYSVHHKCHIEQVHAFANLIPLQPPLCV